MSRDRGVTVQARYIEAGDVLMLPAAVRVVAIEGRKIHLERGVTITPKSRARLRIALLLNISTDRRENARRNIR